MYRKTTILLIAFILGLIFFDAAQQKYYLDTFNLSQNGPVSFSELLSNHFIRWMIWIVVNIPMMMIIWRQVLRKDSNSTRSQMIIGLILLITTLVSLALVSIQSLVVQGVSLSDFPEFFQFFLFQKGLVFVLASVLVIGLLYNLSKLKTIDDQHIEISHLKKITHELQEVLHQEETPHLNVKIGNKLKPISLEDIVWIQSDDYCVKIHTETKDFTLRMSLKALEHKLAHYGFIRIHRTALLNLNYLDQINAETARVRLTNSDEIPYSKNGIRSLKRKIKHLSV